MSFEQRSVSANEDLIKKLFNKVYSAIISEKIFCPPETAVYLAAYACQAKFGSAQGLRNPIPPVKELLPKSILDNHNLTIADWETRISNWHLKLRGVPFLDSIVEYVDTAQDVELYGASIFDVEDGSHTRKWISLDAVGLNIFDSKRKPPTKRYVWSEIGSFTAWDEKIEVVLAHEPHKVLEFYVQHQLTSDLLMSLFNGSKELYSRRKKGETSARYVRRSESNSSMRMRPHKLTSKELFDLEQQVTELELELPRRATDFEYASWQVKDQLRQARGFEARLALHTPSTEDTRRLQHRVAQMRVFLEQDFFNAQKEPSDRPHKYRGNFAIRIGGAYSGRAEGYVSDIDSGSETTRDTPVWKASSSIRPKNQESSDVIHAAPPPQPMPQQPQPLISMATKNITEVSSSSTSSMSKSSSTAFASTTKMPALPSMGMAEGQQQDFQLPQSGVTVRPTFNKDAYPKTAVQLEPASFVTDEPLSLNTSASAHNYGPGYPETSGDFMPRGSDHHDPPGSVGSPRGWKGQGHALRTPGQGGSSPMGRGRQPGQFIAPDDAPLSYRPPVQPKPKVAPRGVAEPHIVTPDHFSDSNAAAAAGDDLRFSSLKAIQSGFAKKRVDLFEAM